MIFCDEIATAE